jgi:CTP:molybdopterin cytidylyltransferase MocA
LKALRGDQGARTLLRSREALTLVDMPEAALDIDTPADIEKLRRATQPTALVAQLTQPVAPLA